MKTINLALGILIATSAMTAWGMKLAQQELVRHVVIFDYKDDASAEAIQSLTDAFRALKDKIPGIIAFEHGVNNSSEGFNQTYTHVYMLTFENIAARDAYLPHPEHQKFVQQLQASNIFEDVFVVDYVPSE